jgi:FMN phosphatase YigB (HAD superfamily)
LKPVRTRSQLREGVDKAFGIYEFLKHTGLAVEDILFVGDSLEEGGTDYPAKKTGADTLAVTSPDDLLQKFAHLLTNE